MAQSTLAMDANTQSARSDLFYLAIFVPAYKRKFSFRGFVKSISAINSEGVFDILPLHENFVTIFSGTLVIVNDDSKVIRLNIGRVLLEASENMVKVYVGL